MKQHLSTIHPKNYNYPQFVVTSNLAALHSCVSCISHAVLFFGIRKDPFNGFLAHLIVSLVPLRIAKLLRHIHIRLPDVLRYRLNKVLVPGTQRSGGAVCTDLWITFIFPVAVTVGCGVFQYLVFRADDTVIVP